jgi:hypothetical protein
MKHWLPGVPTLLQGDDMLCGYYCVWMVRIAYQREDGWADYSASVQLEKQVRRGITLHEVSAELLASKPRGAIPHERRQCDVDDFWTEVTDAIALGKPCLLYLPQSVLHPDGHYVVAVGVHDDANLVVNDPQRGIRTLTKYELSAPKVAAPRPREPEPTVFVPHEALPPWSHPKKP